MVGSFCATCTATGYPCLITINRAIRLHFKLCKWPCQLEEVSGKVDQFTLLVCHVLVAPGTHSVHSQMLITAQKSNVFFFENFKGQRIKLLKIF